MKLLLILSLFLFSSSCIHYTTSHSEPWAQPIDLDLGSESLNGAIIEINCQPKRSWACVDMRNGMENLGATIIGEDDNEVWLGGSGDGSGDCRGDECENNRDADNKRFCNVVKL